MTTNLPPLPEPARIVTYNESKGYTCQMFTADQMHAYARAAMAQASAEPCYTEQQIADACMEAEISDGHCESLLIALGDSAPTAQPAPSADVPEADFGNMAQAGAEPVACAKPFFAYDPDSGITFFETQAEALDYAGSSLKYYREAARRDGEWPGEAEDVHVGVVTHGTDAIGNEVDGFDYIMRGVAPTAQPAPVDCQEQAQAVAAAYCRDHDAGWKSCEAHMRAAPLPAREPLTEAQVLRLFNGPGVSASDRFKINAAMFVRLWRLFEAVNGITATPADKEQS